MHFKISYMCFHFFYIVEVRKESAEMWPLHPPWSSVPSSNTRWTCRTRCGLRGQMPLHWAGKQDKAWEGLSVPREKKRASRPKEVTSLLWPSPGGALAFKEECLPLFCIHQSWLKDHRCSLWWSILWRRLAPKIKSILWHILCEICCIKNVMYHIGLQSIFRGK